MFFKKDTSEDDYVKLADPKGNQAKAHGLAEGGEGQDDYVAAGDNDLPTGYAINESRADLSDEEDPDAGRETLKTLGPFL